MGVNSFFMAGARKRQLAARSHAHPRFTNAGRRHAGCRRLAMHFHQPVLGA